MPNVDLRDFYILTESHPKYNEYKLTENDPMRFVIQKLENLLMSNKGDVLGDPEYGCDLQYFLWKTGVPTETVKRVIYEQVNKYIPELFNFNFSASVDMYEGTVRDIMYINITVQESNVNFVLS